jgi:hypothetical protein
LRCVRRTARHLARLHSMLRDRPAARVSTRCTAISLRAYASLAPLNHKDIKRPRRPVAHAFAPPHGTYGMHTHWLLAPLRVTVCAMPPAGIVGARQPRPHPSSPRSNMGTRRRSDCASRARCQCNCHQRSRVHGRFNRPRASRTCCHCAVSVRAVQWHVAAPHVSPSLNPAERAPHSLLPSSSYSAR